MSLSLSLGDGVGLCGNSLAISSVKRPPTTKFNYGSTTARLLPEVSTLVFKNTEIFKINPKKTSQQTINESSKERKFERMAFHDSSEHRRDRMSLMKFSLGYQNKNLGNKQCQVDPESVGRMNGNSKLNSTIQMIQMVDFSLNFFYRRFCGLQQCDNWVE